MNEKIAQYRERLTQFWGQMGKKQKVWLGASVAGILATIILLTIVFSKTDYELAFKNLDATDAAAVIEYLEGSGIPYELSGSGKNISVPSKDAAKVRVDAGSQGLVQNGSIGFDFFANKSSQLGTTQNEFSVQYQHALNGEIQKLLNGMQGVESSQVLVTRQEESVFLTPEEKGKASASIVMNFKPGYRPAQKEVDGYYKLVKASVQGLELDNIQISSPQGILVSSEAGGLDASGMEAVMLQFQIQQKFEAELANSIKQSLGAFVNLDKTVVMVASSFNFDKKLSKEELVKPLDNNNNNGIIISEQIENSSVTGTGTAPGGIAGTGETDIPTYDAASQNNGTSETSTQIRNYDVNRISNSIESAPYVLKDLTVSVAIDESVIGDEASRAGIMNILTTFVRGKLADSGQNVNDDLLMEKKVSLIPRKFVDNDTGLTAGGISTAWAVGIGAALLALIGGLAVMVVRKRKQPVTEEMELVPPAQAEFPTLDLESINNENQARKNLETLAKRKPDEFVNLLRTWLVDE